MGDDANVGRLTWEQFAQLLLDDACQRELLKLDVDVYSLVDMVEDVFFESSGDGIVKTLTYTQVLDMILELRGSQTASVKDVIAIGKRMNMKFRQLEDLLSNLGTESVEHQMDGFFDKTAP